jgi:hypothetical protein
LGPDDNVGGIAWVFKNPWPLVGNFFVLLASRTLAKRPSNASSSLTAQAWSINVHALE